MPDHDETVLHFYDFATPESAENWRRWNPRRLRVRIDAEIIVPDDRFASRELGACVEQVVRSQWFQDGQYDSGRVENFANTTVALRWTNDYGPNWFWRLVNRWRLR